MSIGYSRWVEALVPGVVFAGYRIEGIAGRGGMGLVYRATHLRLQRLDALKVITPDLAGDGMFRARFERESRVAASIAHPHVISVYYAGEEDGQLYISMQYIEGTDLKELLRSRGRLQPLRAANIVMQVASALDAAHKIGLVHRDVKPANVLLTSGEGEDHAFLTDFGLTKRLASSGGDTRTGMIVGTTDYIAPEQVQGGEVDARTDVYSLGCVLFHLLAGRVPYEREHEIAVVVAHVSAPPPSLVEIAPDLPAALDEVVARAMSKDPDQRYESAGELARATLAAVHAGATDAVSDARHQPASRASSTEADTRDVEAEQRPDRETPRHGRDGLLESADPRGAMAAENDLAEVALVPSAALVARESELDALLATLEEAEKSRPSLTLLLGEAGIGKTRLARELAAHAVRRGLQTLSGECVELSGGEFPYAPLAAALREVHPGAMTAAMAELPPRGRRELARAFPELANDSAGDTHNEAPIAQAELFGWILMLLGRLSSSASLLLIIEDMHWSDVSSRDFLLFLVQRMRQERIAVVITVRIDELHREHPTRRLMTQLVHSDRVKQLILTPFSRDASEQQMTEILGSKPSPELVQRVFQRSEGNPLYTEELLAAGALRSDQLPSTLRDALLLRIETLSPDGQAVIGVMAAIARAAEHALIEASSGLGAQVVREALRECVNHQLLVCDRPSDEYRFRHALLREAVYEDLLPSDRSELHHNVAHALEGDAAGNAAERAHHWEAAGATGPAISASVEAGLAAERIYAHGEALAQFERALRLCPDDAVELPNAPLDHVGLLARAAETARWTGDFSRAQILCRRALAAFDHRDDPARAAALFERLGRYQPWDIETSLESYREALRLLPDEHVAQRMRLKVDVAVALTFLGHWDAARATAKEALGEALGSETKAEESAARAALGVAMAFLGDLSGGEDQLRTALLLAQQAGSPQDLAQAHLDLGEVLRLQGRVEDALDVMLQGERLARRYGASGSYGNFIAVNACDDLFRLGRWDEASDRLRELSRLPVLAPTIELLMTSVAGRLDVARGDLGAATAHFDRAVALCREVNPLEFIPALHAGYAELELWKGEIERANDWISAGLEAVHGGEDALHTPALYSMGARVDADRAERSRSLGHSDDAEQAHRTARERCERLLALLATTDRGVRAPAAEAHLANCKAELARATGHPAPELWAHAATSWRSLACPYAVAYTLYRQAGALTPEGESRSAHALLVEARRLCSELSARPLSDAISALARRAGIEFDALDPPAQAHLLRGQ